MLTTDIAIKLGEVKCPNCGIVFWVDEELKKHRQNDHKTMWCPNGHDLYYPAETEEERLRRLLLEKQRDYHQVVQERDSFKDKVSKLEKRANVGVCLYCHRHFVNLQRHVKTKHPEKLR
jgi:hypothetical protein